MFVGQNVGSSDNDVILVTVAFTAINSVPGSVHEANVLSVQVEAPKPEDVDTEDAPAKRLCIKRGKCRILQISIRVLESTRSWNGLCKADVSLVTVHVGHET